MSQTVTVKLKEKVVLENIQRAFELMGLDVRRNARARMYAGATRQCDLVIPAESLQAMGLRSYAGTDIGLNQSDGGVEFVIDHLNKETQQFLEMMGPSWNEMGANASLWQGYLQQGWSIEPVVDAHAGEYGFQINPPAVQVSQGSREAFDGGDPFANPGGGF
jgi:hypothetical protein